MGLIYEDDVDAIDIMSEGAEIQDLFAERVAAAGPGAQSYLKVLEDDGLGRFGRRARGRARGRFGRAFRQPVKQIKQAMRPVKDADPRYSRKILPPWARGVKHSAAVTSAFAAARAAALRAAAARSTPAARAALRAAAARAQPGRRYGRVAAEAKRRALESLQRQAIMGRPPGVSKAKLLAQQKALRAQHVAHAKRILDKYGMMSDYLQVEGSDFDEMGGAWDFLKIIGMKIGLHDPINYYEPGKSLSEVYAKYKAMAQDMANRIPKLGTVKHREPLMAKLRTLVNDLNRVAPAFRGTSKPGQRDRDRLAAGVQSARFLRREVKAAERAYGIRVPGEEPEPDPPEGAEDPNPIVIPTPTPTPTPTPGPTPQVPGGGFRPTFPLQYPGAAPSQQRAEGMSTQNMMLIGGGTLAALFLVMQMGKKRR